MSVFGSAVFTLSRSRDGLYFNPQLIKISGISEETWERKRPIWYGDCDRERVPPKKKIKTKHDGSVGDGDEESIIEEAVQGEK